MYGVFNMRKILSSLFILMLATPVLADDIDYFQQYGGGRTNTTSTKAPDYYEQPRVVTVAARTAPVATIPSDRYQTPSGFYLGGNIGMAWSDFEFEMNSAKSILSWSNTTWTTLSLNGGYIMKPINKIAGMIDFGFVYGIMMDSGRAIDDDVYNGGIDTTLFDVVNSGTGGGLISEYPKSLKAFSVGGQDGSMMGYHVAFGLKDMWSAGNVTFTPSIGYRSITQELKVEDSRAVFIEVDSNGNPVLYVASGTADGKTIWGIVPWTPVDNNGDGFIDGYVPSNGTGGTPLDSFYDMLSGTTHKYKATWAGPFVAMDIDNHINAANAINWRLEFGLPIYSATANWPDRGDLQHPTSFKDEGSIGQAYHIGAAMNYVGRITPKLDLVLGVVYDYYILSGGDATTNYDLSWYQDQANNPDSRITQADVDYIEQTCGANGSCKTSKEIDARYKQIGARVGIVSKF